MVQAFNGLSALIHLERKSTIFFAFKRQSYEIFGKIEGELVIHQT
jgi:hypothetical protein